MFYNLKEIFRFWFDRGVDALTIGSGHVIYESDDLELDEPLVEQPDVVSVRFFFVVFILFFLDLFNSLI